MAGTSSSARSQSGLYGSLADPEGQVLHAGHGTEDPGDERILRDLWAARKAQAKQELEVQRGGGVARRVSLGLLFLLVCAAMVASNYDYVSRALYAVNVNLMKTFSSTSGAPAGAATSTTTALVTPEAGTEETDAAGLLIDFKMNRIGYTPINLSDDVLYYTHLREEEYDVIYEPHSEMNLVVMDWTDSSIYYKYIVCKAEDTFKANCQEGTVSLDKSISNVNINIPCSPYDEYITEVYGYNAKTYQLISTSYGTGLCLYVRREIRQLSSDDLSQAMDAMYTMYTVSDEVGEELYGDTYKPSSYLLGFHHFNSAWQESDHIHEGNGFMPQHIKMTNIVEATLQSIDPSIALPYWDFTIDQSEGRSPCSSAIMTSDMFGSMKQPKDLEWGFTYSNGDQIVDAAIQDGRWAFLAADSNDMYPDLLAGYGYMRAPWNMNPSPYISRFTMDLKVGTSLPSCTQHYSVLENTDFMTFLYNIQYEPHATTHSLIGGIYGCDLLKPLLEAGYINDEDSLKKACGNWLFYVKEFYRYNYITPNSGCTVGTDVQDSTCGFSCTTDETEMTNFLFNMKNKLESYVPSGMSDDGWQAWVDFVCTGDGGKIFSGDHLESASPADPSFWVIHPTLERLYHAKMMAGGFKDYSWATDAVNDFVCDKAECYMDEYGGLGYWSECCYGHYESSQMLDFTTGNRSQHFGDTNAAVMDITDPTSSDYRMPYIYDSFTWSHCSQDFDSYLREMAAESRRERGRERRLRLQN